MDESDDNDWERRSFGPDAQNAPGTGWFYFPDRPGVLIDGLAQDPEDGFGGWAHRQARRMRYVREAYRRSDGLTFEILKARFQGLDFSAIWSQLGEVLMQTVEYVGGGAVIGGAVGALVGPEGAAGGAIIGAKVGGLILSFLGLKELEQYVEKALWPAAKKMARGVEDAWAAATIVDPDGNVEDREISRAAWCIAEGRAEITAAILIGLLAVLSAKGAAYTAKLISQSKLGIKGAKWFEENAEKLKRWQAQYQQPTVAIQGSHVKPTTGGSASRDGESIGGQSKSGGTSPKQETSRPEPDRTTKDTENLRKEYADEIDNVSTFKTLGVDRATADNYLSSPEGQQLLKELQNADPRADAATIYTRAVDQVTSGANLPTMHTVNSPLVKIVPHGQTVSPYSPYFTTMDDLNSAAKSSQSMADYFGLPVKSESAVYDVYEIRPTTPANVFVSEVAPTTELGGIVERSGGGLQYIVPNRGTWSSPVLVGQIPN